MNLNKLFETQRVLDERIIEKHPELKGQNNLDWKILALQVELGECANEWRGFKKWSNDQEPRVYDANPKDQCQSCKGSGYLETHKDFIEWIFCKECDGVGCHFHNPLLEEYVDCLHFILSMGLEINVAADFDWEELETDVTDIILQYSILFERICEFTQLNHQNYWDGIFEEFYLLGKLLGFTWEQIEAAYYRKTR